MHNDDTTMQLHATANLTSVNNQRQHLNRQAHAQGDAESRAFYAERGQQQASQALTHEQQEHAVTRVAMTRLLAENVAMKKALRYLSERWAEHEGKSAEELRLAWLKDARDRTDGILAAPGNDVLLGRDVEILRDASRLFPKPRV